MTATLIAADGGFYAWKVLRMEKGKEIWSIFPSMWGDFQESKLEDFSTNSRLDIEVDGRRFLFGADAELQSSLPSRPRNAEWVLSDGYKAGLLLGISEVYSPETNPVIKLVTGLPYIDYSRGIEFWKQFINHLKGNHVIYRGSRKKNIIIESVSLTGQNFGPVYRHLIDTDGNLREQNRNVFKVGSVAIGGKTVEIATCQVTLSGNSIKMNAIEKLCHSEERGVYTLIDAVRPILQDKFPRDKFSKGEILRIIETGQTDRFGEFEDIDLSQPIAEFNEGIYNLCTEYYSNETLRGLSKFILTGGGAYLAAPYFHKIDYHPNMVFSQNPQRDTAIGYRQLKRMLDKRK